MHIMNFASNMLGHVSLMENTNPVALEKTLYKTIQMWHLIKCHSYEFRKESRYIQRKCLNMS